MATFCFERIRWESPTIASNVCFVKQDDVLFRFSNTYGVSISKTAESWL